MKHGDRKVVDIVSADDYTGINDIDRFVFGHTCLKAITISTKILEIHVYRGGYGFQTKRTV